MDYQSYLNDLFLKNAKPGRIITQLRATLGSLPIVLRALMDRSKKKIRIITSASATTGSTDLESNVTLPMVPLPTREDDVDSYVDIAALLYGLIHHEVGHINDTAPGYMEQCTSKLHGFILNIIEDVRQELLHIKRFPGARPYLNALAMVMHKRGQMAVPSHQDGPAAVFTAFLLYRLYAEFRNEPVAIDQYPAVKAVAEQVFTDGFIVRISPIIAEFHGVKSTHAAFIMSQKLMAFLQHEREEADKQQKASNQSSNDGDGAQDPTAGNNSGDDSDQDSNSDQGDDGQSSGGDQASNNADDDTSDDDGQSSSGDGSQDPADDGDVDHQGSGSDGGNQTKSALAQLLDDPDLDGAMSGMHEQAREQLDQMVNSKHNDPSFDPTAPELLGDIETAQEQLRTGLQHDLRQAMSVSGPLRRKLLSQLDALTNPNKRAAVKGRKLSGRHLSRIISGDPRVFEVSDDGYEVDTAVLLLQDVSSSMAGEKIKVASQALYATSLSMSGIDGLQLSAITFPGNSWVIRPNESPRRNQSRFGLKQWGYTPMAQAIQLGTRMLMNSGKVRMLMIVLTDGQPDDHDTAATAIAVAQSQGIEVYGVGILTPQYRDLFDKWTTITDLQELPEKLSGMVRDKVFDRLAA